MSLYQQCKNYLHRLYIGHKLVFRSVIPDLHVLNFTQATFLILFGCVVVLFNILDFNSLVHGNTSDSKLIKYTNDKSSGVEEWRRILMCLSAIASFSGAMSVVLTSLGKLSCFFWGIINCIFYGLYAFAYGYAGDAQLNIMFLWPMQYIGWQLIKYYS
jgi:nicotinamide mononucleotide transporter